MSIDWNTLPSLSALRAFEATARLGSFSAAARTLNVTHAAIAQQVRALEADLGLGLVYREGRGMALTAEGAQLAEGLSQGFATLRDSIDALRLARADRPLQIALTPAFATHWLMPRLADFWKTHPQITVSLHPERRVVDLIREGFDLAIRFGAGAWPGLEAEKLIEAGYIIAAAPSLTDGRSDLSYRELQELPWLVADNWPEPRAWLSSLGLDLDRMKITRFATEDLVIAAALQGYGAYVDNKVLAEDHLRAGRLIKLTRAEDPAAAYYLLTRPGAADPRLKSFVRWLKKSVPDQAAS